MLDPNILLQAGGVLGVLIIALVLFAETGLLIGFFLPGDTLLIAAGVLAKKDILPLWLLLPVAAVASIIGYEVGYRIGKNAGPRFFKRKDGFLFRLDYVHRTEAFFDRHGGKTILLARFIAVIRTIVPLMAGMGKMDKTVFRFYNIVGGILWTVSLILATYWISGKIPNLDNFIIPLVLLAMIVTSVSLFFEVFRSPVRRRALKKALGDEIHYFFKRPRS